MHIDQQGTGKACVFVPYETWAELRQVPPPGPYRQCGFEAYPEGLEKIPDPEMALPGTKALWEVANHQRYVDEKKGRFLDILTEGEDVTLVVHSPFVCDKTQEITMPLEALFEIFVKQKISMPTKSDNYIDISVLADDSETIRFEWKPKTKLSPRAVGFVRLEELKKTLRELGIIE